MRRRKSYADHWQNLTFRYHLAANFSREDFMAIRIFAGAVLVFLAASASNACMRLQMDDRAVQWSTAIVEAKLVSIDAPVRYIGEHHVFKPDSGEIIMWYYYRAYHMQVTRSLDGPYKKGDSVTIVRLFWSDRGGGACQQNLTNQSVGKEFLAMLMPVSGFKMFVPEGMTGMKVKDPMFIVHLELKETLSPTAIPELERRIASVRDAEKQIDPAQVDRLIGQIRNATNIERAGPAARALERMGPKILPKLEAGMKTMPVDARQSKLYEVITRISPPPTTQEMVWPDVNIEQDTGHK
jgi:hypothetical protein